MSPEYLFVVPHRYLTSMIDRFVIRIIGGTIGVLVGFAIGLYVVKFMSHPLSDNPEHWGQFGDYMGGVLNPVISILTLIVTVLIAKTVSDIQTRQSIEQLNTQRTLLLTEFKYMKLREVSDEFRKAFSLDEPAFDPSNGMLNPAHYTAINNLIIDIRELDAHLFHIDTEMRQRIEQVLETLEEIANAPNPKTIIENFNMIYMEIKTVIDSLYKSVLTFEDLP